MISLTTAHQQLIESAVRDAFPEEACGLIVGHKQGGDWVADDIVPSENLSPTPQTNFEVDMRLRLRLQRELRGSGNAIIGHYHSHPNGRSEPSAMDLESAWEDDIVWLVIAVDGRAQTITAHHYCADINDFTALELQVIEGA